MRDAKMTRRDFLKTPAAMAMVGGVTPWRWSPAHAHAPPPNEGIGVLAIGVRGRGGGIGREAGKLGRVVAVCDVDISSIDLFLRQLSKQQESKPALYKDYRKALERKDVDVVTIGTPDHWHTPILIAALRAGKDVYCEKPMTLTVAEGKKICKVVIETGRVVQVGTQQRTEYRQMFLKAVAIARSGRLGRQLTATCSIGGAPSGGPFPTADPPATLDWDFWLGPAPKVEYCQERCHNTFRWWFEYSGGKMTDWGAHHVDIAQWAIGAEHTGPLEIEGTGDLPYGREATVALLTGKAPAREFPNGFNTATKFRVTMKFASGNTIIVQDGPGNGIDLKGEKGQIFVSRSSLTGAPIDEIAASENDSEWLRQEVIRLYNGVQPTTHMANFIYCVKSRAMPIADVFTHHRAVSSCHLCNIALLLGRPLKWVPAAEDFIGDPEASALRSRPERKKYAMEA